MKVISTWVHGVLDYSISLVIFFLPFLFGWSARVATLLTLVAIGTTAYSLMTRYELGASKVLPMRFHLAIDFATGLVLVVLALFLTAEPAPVRWTLGALGLFEIAAAALTETVSSVEARPDVRRRARGL